MPLSTSKLLIANGVARGDVAFAALARLVARPVISGAIGAGRFVGRKLLGAGPPARKLLTGTVIPGIAGAVTLPTVKAGRTALLKRAAKGAAGIAVGAAGATAIERAAGGMFAPGVRRRRMNPANFRALSRATRRLSAFHRLAMRAESNLRKFAPRARTRRCPPVRKPCR